MKAVPEVAALVLVPFGLHSGAPAMERRGWIFYRDSRATATSRSNAFQSVQARFEPEARHAVEEGSWDGVDESESGGPPGAGPLRR